MCLWSYSDQHLGFFNFNFNMIIFLASIVLNIKMFFYKSHIFPSEMIFIKFFYKSFFPQKMQSPYFWLKYCSYSFFTISLSSP